MKKHNSIDDLRDKSILMDPMDAFWGYESKKEKETRFKAIRKAEKKSIKDELYERYLDGDFEYDEDLEDDLYSRDKKSIKKELYKKYKNGELDDDWDDDNRVIFPGFIPIITGR